jgi:transposase InsO family protein
MFDKSEVQGKVKTVIRRAQREFELPIKKVRSDNGSEFQNTNAEEFLDEEGIKHEFSAPYTPQQNGVVERKNQTLIEMAKTMLYDIFWAEVINMPCDAINRLYLHKFHKKTSYELITVKSLRCPTLECLGANVSLSTRDPEHLSLHQRLAKDFFLVMVLMSMLIDSSI